MGRTIKGLNMNKMAKFHKTVLSDAISQKNAGCGAIRISGSPNFKIM